jgi:hypothetical protein
MRLNRIPQSVYAVRTLKAPDIEPAGGGPRSALKILEIGPISKFLPLTCGRNEHTWHGIFGCELKGMRVTSTERWNLDLATLPRSLTVALSRPALRATCPG